MSAGQPVTVRLYGCISVTRSRYLFQLIFALILASYALIQWWLSWPSYRAWLEKDPTPLIRRLIAFWDNLPWILLAVLVLQAIEAYVVLRLFARKAVSATTAVPLTESQPHNPG
jgi:hypothetical protein